MTTVTPLGDNVLVAPVVVKEQTASGLYLPETAAQEKPQEGKVIAIGNGDDIAVKTGQRVIYRQYAGTEVTIDGDDFLIVKSEDVLAIVK
jgi:chaperonin GroES